MAVQTTTTTSTTTPRRALLRPRSSKSALSTAISTPNLKAAYQNDTVPPLPPFPKGTPGTAGALRSTPSLSNIRALGRKPSYNALTSGSLASIPDATAQYPLSTVIDDENTSPGLDSTMVGYTPGRGNGEAQLGDLVDVPGDMYGVVKFVGSVDGKKGTFAGIELAEQFVAYGKNNGDVNGVQYFNTALEGAGIFVPVARAVKRNSRTPSVPPLTPRSPSVGGMRMQSGGYSNFTPPTPSLPRFAQSVGPGARAPSPQFKKSRPSLPRPESPIRRNQTLTPGPRPSVTNTPGPGRYAPSPTPSKFSKSVSAARDASGDPLKKLAFTPRKPNFGASVGPRSASALGNAPLEFSDDDTTPVNVQKVKRQDNDSLGSTSSFNAKMRPAESRAQEEEIHRLRTQLEDRDKQLKEQAASLAEMENSLNEVQSLMGGSDAGRSHNRNSMEDKDAAHLRALLREKNEKIAMLTSEFDAHRADFRSTIDTLEMAATETERVYESRVQELLMELKDYKEKSDDVYSVAAQLKQLEELVQELEEGLEDARRGESEARSEVEFLQGEVERTKAELRREREKTLAAEQAPKVDHQAQKEIEQRDDEIRGLKAIIHSLSSNEESNGTPRGSISESDEAKQKRENLERQVNELRSIIDRKNSQEEELEREIERLRRSSVPSTANPQRASAMTVASTGTVTAGARFNRGSGGSWREQNAPRSPEQHRRGNTLDTMPESDTYSATTDGSTLWCEICETAGHDILTCTNVFSSKSGVMNNKPSQSTLKPNDSMRGDGEDRWKPAPLSPARRQPPTQPLPAPPVQVMPDPSHDGPVAGKDSGVIDANKWCAVCERDGHDALDCPFEGAF